ncbi:MAG: C25 family cysteine peptidase [Candidatus Hatepunaea meridiana]|nr:C25 family cysteine peptidase [Candidatus Hatepunaea meridiana]
MLKVIHSALVLILIVLVPLAAVSNPQTALNSHATILNSSAQAITLGFDLAEIEREEILEENQSFDSYSLEDEGFTLVYGMPKLPSITRTIIVPPDAGLELVIRADEPRRVRADNPPLLSGEELLTRTPDNLVMAAPDVPKLNNIYPPVVAEMSEPFVMRGARMVHITTYPVRYDPQENVYLHYDNIETDIRFTNAPPINPSRYPVRRNRSPQFLKFIRDYAINGDIVGRDDPDRDRDQEYLGHYLLVIHENLVEDAEPFIEWRRKSGWKVEIYSVPSNDSRNINTIKGEIQERYDNYLEAGIDPFDHIHIIGDYRDHGGCGPGSQNVIETHLGRSCWSNNTNHKDWWYACLEGGNNDDYADVGISRWWSGNSDLMALTVGRTLSYEMEPYMENTDWFTRGAVYAQNWAGNYHVSLATNVRWGKSALEALGFDDVRTYENMTTRDSNGAMVVPFITRQFNDGVNVMIGRAENYGYRNSFPVNNNVIYPIDLDVAGHHEWSCWHMTRTGNGNNMKGPVAATSAWGGPATLPMSLIWLELVNGFLQRDLTLGWSYIKGVIGASGCIPNFIGAFYYVTTDYVCFGDPGIQYWQGVPQEVDVVFPEVISTSDRLVEVYVRDAENDDEAVQGAQVTIYFPGDMPNPDDDDYAEYEDMFMLTKKTDEEGLARFVFPDGNEFEEGTMYATVTGRNIYPNINEIEIEEFESGIELTEWTLDQTSGNNDDEINPDERFSLFLTALNRSEDDDLRDVVATITSLSSYVEVAGNNEIEFGDIDAEQEVESDDVIRIRVAEDCPDGASRPITVPSLRVLFSSRDEEWETAIPLDVVAPNFEVKEIVGNGIISYEIEHFNIDIENIGRMPASELNATLVTLGMGVSVVDAESGFPALDPGDHSRFQGAAPRVTGNRLVPPGSTYEMVLILETEDDFVDSAFFRVQIMEPRERAPQGPDNYGYICFDDTDTDWDIAPQYEWVEISPREDEFDFRGERLDFDGNSQLNIGETIVIDLPFETQFYGRLYDQITIATNGFISMGDQEYVTNYQNWPMDHCIGGGAGMLAPFWDDLSLSGNDAGIYTYYHEDDSRFIVEWYKLRHRSGGNSDLIFQVILYDNEIWITETGDQNILFQYKQIENRVGRGTWTSNASPYASVGISGPEGNSGINYTFNNIYPVTSARLENRRALLFGTSPRYKSGTLYGRITDARTHQPIDRAIISTQHGFTAISDEDGNWRINDALADIEFQITCIKSAYNDTTKYELLVEEDSELEINFNLLHPEFTSSNMQLTAMIDPEWQAIIPFNIRNEGNGPLDWTMERRLPGNAEADPWEHRLSYPIGQIVNDARIEGVIYIDGLFYACGANRQGREDGPNMIYVLERVINDDGEEEINEINRYEQCGESNYGFRDMAYDGELIWASGERAIYSFYPENGEMVDSLEGSFSSHQALTWDSNQNILWASGITSQYIAGLDVDGEEVARLPRNGLRIYGLAYWPDDPDGFPLYIFNSPESGRQVLHKMNPENNDTMFVHELVHEEGGTPNGAFATNQFDVYSWVFVDIANDGSNDRIDIWQIDARRDWFRIFSEVDNQRIEYYEGRIDAGEDRDFELTLSSVDLPMETYESFLWYYHNAEGGETVIDVTLEVIGQRPPSEFSLLLPADNDTLDANIDTTIVTFEWEPSIDPNHEDVMTYLLWCRSGADTAMISADTDSLSVNLIDLVDSLGLSIEVEFPIFWWVKVVSGEDTVNCARRYCFTFLPNKVIGPGDGIPIEFGLQTIYPSPFNSMTTIRFGVDKHEVVNLNVYDLMGRRVTTLYCGEPIVGYHNIVWDASALASGLYIVQLEGEGRVETAKIALLR